MAWRTGRRIRAQAPYLLVILLLAVSVGYLAMWPGHWRRGAAIVAVAAALAGAFRLILPTPRAGLLAVRGRLPDALCYLLLGAVILTVEIRLH
jgi:hypothetical protein